MTVQRTDVDVDVDILLLPLSGILFHLSMLCRSLSKEIVSSSLNGVAIGG